MRNTLQAASGNTTVPMSRPSATSPGRRRNALWRSSSAERTGASTAIRDALPARFLGAELPGDVPALEQDAVPTHLQIDAFGKVREAADVARREAPAGRGKTDRPVDRPAVEPVPAEPLGNPPADLALARCVGAVDADDGDAHSRSCTSTPALRSADGNPGNEVATFAQSSISTAPCEPSAARAKVIAIRWSPRLAIRAARNGPRRPCTTIPSGRGSTDTPRRWSPSSTAASRSLSLTRSSPAPRNTVTPSAQAAARSSTGSSSMPRATRSPSISTPPEPARARNEVRHRLAAGVAAVLERDLRPHAFEDPQHAVAGRVDADARDPDPPSPGDARSDEKEGGGGEIAGHRNGLPLERAAAHHGDGARGAFHLVSESGEHPLGVVAGGRRLLDPRAATGVEPREQEARLHLRARNLGAVVDSGEPAPAPDRERRGAAGRRLDLRPHLRQRLGDPAHRAPRQRLVPHEGGVEPLARKEPGEEAKTGPRVPEIEGTGRSFETVPAATGDPERARTVRFDGDPERADRPAAWRGCRRPRGIPSLRSGRSRSHPASPRGERRTCRPARGSRPRTLGPAGRASRATGSLRGARRRGATLRFLDVGVPRALGPGEAFEQGAAVAAAHLVRELPDPISERIEPLRDRLPVL